MEICPFPASLIQELSIQACHYVFLQPDFLTHFSHVKELEKEFSMELLSPREVFVYLHYMDLFKAIHVDVLKQILWYVKQMREEVRTFPDETKKRLLLELNELVYFANEEHEMKHIFYAYYEACRKGNLSSYWTGISRSFLGREKMEQHFDLIKEKMGEDYLISERFIRKELVSDASLFLEYLHIAPHFYPRFFFHPAICKQVLVNHQQLPVNTYSLKRQYKEREQILSRIPFEVL